MSCIVLFLVRFVAMYVSMCRGIVLCMGRQHPEANNSNAMAEKEREDDDDCFADIGFMFMGAEPSTLQWFQWKTANDTAVQVSVQAIDDNPGALQSGHFLWPVAPALAQHLLNMKDAWSPRTLLELGAGCALPTLAALQIFSESLQRVVVTDHDPGTLEKARENHERNMFHLQQNEIENTQIAEQEQFADRVASIPFLLESLSWGDRNAALALVSRLQSTAPADGIEVEIDNATGFDLILGSDLIYCQDVVKPLFSTASLLMPKDTPASCKFILAQSFPYDDVTEQEIDNICADFGFQRNVCLNQLGESSKGGVKIQEFRWR